MSKIIRGETRTELKCHEEKEVDSEKNQTIKGGNSVEISVSNVAESKNIGCTCTRKNVNLKETKGVGTMINDLLEGRQYSNAKIKIEIELN